MKQTSKKTHSKSLQSVVEEQAPLAAHPLGVKQSDSLFDFPEPLHDHSERSSQRTRTAKSGNPLLTLVNQTGVFDMEVLFCICPNAGDRDEQLLKAGLLSSSFKQIETAFTFSVLDDFLADNLECKTTAQQYYSKLQSITNRMFPDHVPVCYNDFQYDMVCADNLNTESLQTALEGISPMARPKEPDAKWDWISTGGKFFHRWIHGHILSGMSATRHQPSRRLEGKI
jgi:CxC2 like cysteine cluster associated with KDZ transposases